MQKNPSLLLYPCSLVLVTCVDGQGKSNIIPLAWVGVACVDPPMLTMGIRPNRYSNGLISETKQFVVNIPKQTIIRQTDFCGQVSGREVDKFSETGLTPIPSSKIKPPLIKECPVNMECILKQVIKLGTHDLFLGEIVALHVDSEILDKDGNIDLAKAAPIVFAPEEYWCLGKKIGNYGLSKRDV